MCVSDLTTKWFAKKVFSKTPDTLIKSSSVENYLLEGIQSDVRLQPLSCELACVLNVEGRK